MGHPSSSTPATASQLAPEKTLQASWPGLPFPDLCPTALAPLGSRAVAPKWSRDTAAGGCDTASCVQAPEWGQGPQHPPGARSWSWEAKSVLPLGGGALQTCSPLLTLVSGFMILLPFLSLGHRDPLALGHVAPRRHSPGAQGILVKLLPEERSGHWVGKRGLTGGFRPVLPLSP